MVTLMEFFPGRYGDKYTDIKRLAGKWDHISLIIQSFDFNISFSLPYIVMLTQ